MQVLPTQRCIHVMKVHVRSTCTGRQGAEKEMKLIFSEREFLGRSEPQVGLLSTPTVMQSAMPITAFTFASGAGSLK